MNLNNPFFFFYRRLADLQPHVEIHSLDGLETKISQVKGSPGKATGGPPSGQSGGHMSPGEECFAPLSNMSINSVHLEKSHDNRFVKSTKRIWN